MNRVENNVAFLKSSAGEASEIICMWERVNGSKTRKFLYFNPFLTLSHTKEIYAADDFEVI